MADDSQPGRKRLALDIETIIAINEAIAKYLDQGDGPLDRVHGSLMIEIVKGQFQRIIPAPSILLTPAIERKKRARSA